jgi:hypothetical protein
MGNQKAHNVVGSNNQFQIIVRSLFLFGGRIPHDDGIPNLVVNVFAL